MRNHSTLHTNDLLTICSNGDLDALKELRKRFAIQQSEMLTVLDTMQELENRINAQ